jgi:hypothetical protein
MYVYSCLYCSSSEADRGYWNMWNPRGIFWDRGGLEEDRTERGQR